VKKLTPSAEMTRDSFVAEAKLLHRLRHRHLVLLLGVCTVGEPILIIMELLSNGSLNDYLRSDPGRSLCFSVLVAFSAQVGLIDSSAYRTLSAPYTTRQLNLNLTVTNFTIPTKFTIPTNPIFK